MGTARDRVLVVEDDPAVSRLLMRLLERAGREVLCVGGGAEVAAALETGPFRAAIVDCDLPGAEDGLGVARRLRAARPETAVVMTSGRPDNLQRAAEAGFTRTLPKPFTPAEVEALLASL
ncbi:MAG: response regulator [Elusimicrobia bacterium]|nr:response regulator [Elusimicrobiota bacterium]